MISKFVREQKRYTQQNLKEIFECSAEKTAFIIKRLKEYGVLKAVRFTDIQLDKSDLVEEDVEVSDVEIDGNNYLYIFTYVGVITVAGIILKCYPKYILSNSFPREELKQIIKVIERYNTKEQIISLYNENDESGAFNLLAVAIFLMHDYYENGSYTNTQEIIEENGVGEILWDKTINDTFTMFSNNRPYYLEILTKRRVTDDQDFFKRLHESVLSILSKELKKADLIDLFDLMPINLSDEIVEEFGDVEYILYRIQNELNVQFNTRKQSVLKILFAYVAHSGSLSSVDGFSMFGTNSYNLVWEKVCAEVMNNQLNRPLASLNLDVSLHNSFNGDDTLLTMIEKPNWIGRKSDKSLFSHKASDTLRPDIVTILSEDQESKFLIFDAKYYTLQLEPSKVLKGQPGVSDVTKQYLYQLAYKNFIEKHKFKCVKNCFLLPTEQDEYDNLGYVELNMMNNLGLEKIQIRLLPAVKTYDYFLRGIKMDIELLKL